MREFEGRELLLSGKEKTQREEEKERKDTGA